VNREEERVVQCTRRGKGEAPGSVRSHVRAEGSGLSACDPDGRAVVKEVFGSACTAPGEASLEGFSLVLRRLIGKTRRRTRWSKEIGSS
jgi:hypothetical protein